MRTIVRVLLTFIFLAVAGFLGYDMANYYLYSPWTRDARVRADVVPVAPDVSGYIDDVRVKNDQFVHKGDVLFLVDQERYRIALADAEAALAVRQAQHLMALEQYQRRSKLTPGYSVTVETLDNARRQSESAAASYQQAIASRDNAALNLKRTEVAGVRQRFHNQPEPFERRLCRPGQAGDGADRQRFISRRGIFRRNQDSAHQSRREIRLMDGSPALQGTVLGIARGITDQDNRDGPELLSSVNPSFTWVRLAQRIPVRIRLTHVPPGVLVSAGMTCTVIMTDGMQPRIGASMKSLMSRAAMVVQTTVARGDTR